MKLKIILMKIKIHSIKIKSFIILFKNTLKIKLLIILLIKLIYVTLIKLNKMLINIRWIKIKKIENITV